MRILGAGASVLILAGAISVAAAFSQAGGSQPTVPHPLVTKGEYERWQKELSNWGRWGPDDELGTLNLITPAKRLQAAGLVREGVVISCARTIGWGPAIYSPVPARHFMLQSGEGEPAQALGRSGASDAFLLQPHGVSMTHLDAPA